MLEKVYASLVDGKLRRVSVGGGGGGAPFTFDDLKLPIF